MLSHGDGGGGCGGGGGDPLEWLVTSGPPLEWLAHQWTSPGVEALTEDFPWSGEPTSAMEWRVRHWASRGMEGQPVDLSWSGCSTSGPPSWSGGSGAANGACWGGGPTTGLPVHLPWNGESNTGPPWERIPPAMGGGGGTKKPLPRKARGLEGPRAPDVDWRSWRRART